MFRLLAMAAFAVSVATVGPASGAAAAEAHCVLQSMGELPVTVDEDGEILTDAQIDGKPVSLVVDTGAFGTLLFYGEAQKLGLALRQTYARAYGVGGESNIYSARVKEFRLGDLSIRNVDLVVTGKSLGAQGLLGAKFLLQADVEFDVPHGKIRFFKPHDCKGDQVVYWGQAYAAAPLTPEPDDSLVVTVQVNDKPVVAVMDTGATASVLTDATAARVGVTPQSPQAEKAGDVRGLGPKTEAQSVAVFDSFGFGDETIHHAALRIADLFRHAAPEETGSRIPGNGVGDPEMLLGADFFRSHRIFIAREQHMAYASYEGGPVFWPIEPAKP